MSSTLGNDLRQLRKLKGFTLTELASLTGRSVGWHSQIERDLSTPSIRELESLAQIFDVPLSILFGSPDADARESGRIVRGGHRRVIGERENGLIEELLSPDLTDSFEVIHSTFLPGTECGNEIVRATQELAFLVSGKLDIQLDGEAFTVSAGDSFRLRGTVFRWANPYSDPAIAVWVISPPVY
ncbi:helix-turn-helix domain-containing protein [Rhodobacterales bacterium]|nr:helix-turn-helix domain-containing protein [Rhodobacterales bacterium]